MIIHAFGTGPNRLHALCGSSNADDGDAPASEDWTEVTCPDCLRRRPSRIVTARTEPDDQAPGYYRLVLNHDGRIVITGESYTVCANVADALLHPERWIGTECGEIADQIRKVYGA